MPLCLGLQALEAQVGREALADLLALPPPLLLSLQTSPEAFDLALRRPRGLVGSSEARLQHVRVFHAATHDLDGPRHLRQRVHLALQVPYLRVTHIQVPAEACRQLGALLAQFLAAAAGGLRGVSRTLRRLAALAEVCLSGCKLGVHVAAPCDLCLQQLEPALLLSQLRAQLLLLLCQEVPLRAHGILLAAKLAELLLQGAELVPLGLQGDLGVGAEQPRLLRADPGSELLHGACPALQCRGLRPELLQLLRPLLKPPPLPFLGLQGCMRGALLLRVRGALLLQARKLGLPQQREALPLGPLSVQAAELLLRIAKAAVALLQEGGNLYDQPLY
mmetsp:Transcript_109589/g.353718  ORF Transcript_109589/g.353718 Transcript_109589/m.353718 type:complete len:333 (-) Transcript_109589:981-1979(-)